MVKKDLDIPLIAAGGIATGAGMLAAMILGADAVQVGTRFVASDEASSHINFKNEVLKAREGDTKLTLKELAPVRLLKNKFYDDIESLYTTSPSKEDLKQLLGRARAKQGMFEGDLKEGELEIGQISGLIDSVIPAKIIVENLIAEFETAKLKASQIEF
jgi:enoyl-[acyl-carrier protein] reductase II